MDVDNSEIDLISQFRSMQTNDKECLIEEFRRLSNTHLSNEGCMFYLDLANWNLNTALWAYYEYDGQDVVKILPAMKFICDVTIGDGEAVAPNTRFIKKWRVNNCGNIRWPPGCNLRLITGAKLHVNDVLIVEALNPEETADICVEMLSPSTSAIYQSQYRLFTPTGTPFGDPIWLCLNVEEGGILGITQQLNSVNMFGNNNNNLNVNVNNNNNNNDMNVAGASSCLACNIQQPNNQIVESKPFNPFNTSSASPTEQQQQQDEKRPDFYDEMFS